MGSAPGLTAVLPALLLPWAGSRPLHGAVLPIIRQNGFFDIFMGAAGKEITNAENPTVFRFMASSDQLYYTFTPDIYRKLNIKRVAFMGPNNDLGRSDVKVLKDIAKIGRAHV